MSRACVTGSFCKSNALGRACPLWDAFSVCQSACPPAQFRTRRPHFPSPRPLPSANICPSLLRLPTTPSICIYICISPCLSLAPFQSSLALPDLLLLTGANSAGHCQGEATQLKTTTITVGLPHLSLPPRHLHLDGYLQSSVHHPALSILTRLPGSLPAAADIPPVSAPTVCGVGLDHNSRPLVLSSPRPPLLQGSTRLSPSPSVIAAPPLASSLYFFSQAGARLLTRPSFL